MFEIFLTGCLIMSVGAGMVLFALNRRAENECKELKILMVGLVTGIHEWGSMEDGVPDEVYEPFIQAGVILGILIDTSRVQEYGAGYIWKENSYEIVEPIKKN